MALSVECVLSWPYDFYFRHCTEHTEHWTHHIHIIHSSGKITLLRTSYSCSRHETCISSPIRYVSCCRFFLDWVRPFHSHNRFYSFIYYLSLFPPFFCSRLIWTTVRLFVRLVGRFVFCFGFAQCIREQWRNMCLYQLYHCTVRECLHIHHSLWANIY